MTAMTNKTFRIDAATAAILDPLGRSQGEYIRAAIKAAHARSLVEQGREPEPVYVAMAAMARAERQVTSMAEALAVEREALSSAYGVAR